MQTYELGGPNVYNWKQIITNISLALKKNKWMVPAPVSIVKIVAFIFDRFKNLDFLSFVDCNFKCKL